MENIKVDELGENLSIVVQGPIYKFTRENLLKIKELLPKAEIIISTWENEENLTLANNINFATIIFNSDPGSNGLIRKYPHKQVSNLDRQIISSYNGLKASHKDFCLKIRSDAIIKNINFIKIYNRFKDYKCSCTHYKSRIMVEGLTTTQNLNFAIGDWWGLGTREDLIEFWNVEISQQPAYSIELSTKDKKNLGVYLSDVVCKSSPEQYITIKNLEKIHNIKIHNKFISENLTKYRVLYSNYLLHNFICAEPRVTGIFLPKATNIINPVGYRYNLPFVKWIKFIKEDVNYKNIKIDDLGIDVTYDALEKEYNSIEVEYCNNESYYNISNYAYIIKNYSKFRPSKFKVKKLTQSNLSFVITGMPRFVGDKPDILSCAESIKKFFPESKIILSLSSDVDYRAVKEVLLIADDVVWNDEKSKYIKNYCHINEIKKFNTTSWQQICAHNGLLHVKTDFAARLRCDSIFIRGNLVELYNDLVNKFLYFDKDYNIFEQRVLIPKLVTRDPVLCNGRFPYQLSDLFCVGLLSDIIKLWDGHIISDFDQNYFLKYADNLSYSNDYGFNHRLTSEQDFLINAIKHSNVANNYKFPEYYNDTSSEDFAFLTEKFFTSNVVVSSFDKIGLVTKFKVTLPEFNLNEFLTEVRFKELYLCNIECSDTLLTELKQDLDEIRKNKTMTQRDHEGFGLKKMLDRLVVVRVFNNFLLYIGFLENLSRNYFKFQISIKKFDLILISIGKRFF